MTRLPPWRCLVACLVACVAVLGLSAAAAGAVTTPTLTVTAPADATDYAQAAVPAAAFACPGATCTVVVDGGTPLSSGGALPATPGSHAFTVTALALDGGSASQSGTYTVSAPPTVTISAPADGHSYNANAVPAADFTCHHDPNSALQACTARVDGNAVADGAAMPSTPGQHTLTVTATDADGSSSPPTSATYTVFPLPTCNDISATTNEGARVRLRPSCADPHAPSIAFTVGRPSHGTITTNAEGAIFYTPSTGFSGTDSFAYRGTSADGVSAPHTVTVHVLAPPTAQIVAPAAGQVYTVGQSVPTRFSCADDPAGPGLRSCIDSRGASHGAGTLDTSSEGRHTYTVTATSADGQTGRATIAYTVVGRAPQVIITAPVNNAAYLWTAIPPADFTCLAGAGSTIQSCKATVGGQPIANHQALPNAFGPHVLTVTATDADGLTSTASATYTSTVSTVALPPVTIRSPRQGGTYRLGQAVAARYSCTATSTGPALTSCVGTVRAGRRIDTTTLGRHTFTVSATNAEGNSTTEAVTYRVVHTTNHFTVVGLRATRSGAARLALKLPGPGSVRVLARAWNATGRASRHHIAYGTAAVSARRAGALSLVVRPTAAGRALLRTKGARPVIALAVTYKPTGARPRVVHPALLKLTRSSHPTARR
jgi:hypothetical protein